MKNNTHKKDKFNKWDCSILVLFLILLPSIVIFLQNSNKMITFQENHSVFENPIVQTSILHQLHPEFFNYSKIITIDHSKVIGNHSNFPVLISLFDSDLHDHAQNSGNDIVFYSNTPSQWLEHEIELYNKNYNGTHAQLIAWVRVPLLSNSVDTVITMYFGNSTIGSEQNPEGVWDENYVMVQHLNGNTYSELNDSTNNNNDVSNQFGTPNYNVDGWIGNAVKFDGDNGDKDGLIVGDSNSLDITSNITLSAWVKFDAIENTYDKIMVKTLDGGEHDPYNCYAMALNQYDSYFRMEMSDGTGGSQRIVERQIAASLSTWYFVTVSYDQTTMRISVNGEDDITNNVDSMTIATSSAPLTIGREYIEKEYLDGIIDEVRISNIARSHDWILTEYANQNDPHSFYSIGESVRLDFNAPSVVIDPFIPSGPYGQNQTYKEVEINATITDAETGVLKAIAMIDGDEPFNITMNPIVGKWMGVWDNVSEYSNGDYRITIWAIDEVGNINQKESIIVTVINSIESNGGTNGGPGEDWGPFIILIIILAVIGSVGIIGMYGFMKIKNRKKLVPNIKETKTSLNKTTRSFKELTPVPKLQTIERKSSEKFDKNKIGLTPVPQLKTIERKESKTLDKNKMRLTSSPVLKETINVSKVQLQDEFLKKELKKKSAGEKLELLKKIGKDKDKLD